MDRAVNEMRPGIEAADNEGFATGLVGRETLITILRHTFEKPVGSPPGNMIDAFQTNWEYACECAVGFS